MVMGRMHNISTSRVQSEPGRDYGDGWRCSIMLRAAVNAPLTLFVFLPSVLSSFRSSGIPALPPASPSHLLPFSTATLFLWNSPRVSIHGKNTHGHTDDSEDA